MQIIKLLFITLAVCFCSFLSAQNPALLTRYNWNADTDSWQQEVREIHSPSAPQEEVVLSQIWDAGQRSWQDWTRTTTRFDDAGLAIFRLTEKMVAGEFINVIKKEFLFDAEGRILSQTDYKWDERNDHWLNLYQEIRKYAPQFGEKVSTLNERIIMRPDASQQGWEEEEKYVSFQFAVGDGIQHFSRRHVFIDGTYVLQDQLVTRIMDSGQEEILMEGGVGNWTPVSKKVTKVNEFTSSVSSYIFSHILKDWEQVAFENTYFNERGDVRNIKEEKMNTTFSYNESARVTEILYTKPLEDAYISKEVYAYEDQLELSHEAAQFDMVLFPNPMQHSVRLKLSEWIPGTRQVKVMDMQGRVLQHLSFTSSSDMLINRQDLAAGTYIVQLLSSQGVKTAQLVVTE